MNNYDSTSLLVREPIASSTTMQMSGLVIGSIDSLESLRDHLQWAIELEHSTIPPYLCALYSIKAGHNAEAPEVLSSVVVEEMLHLTLAANLLNAVGGQPRLDIPEMLPGHPRPLPHGDRSFEISLFRFCPEAIETFLKIEQPSQTGAPPEDDNYRRLASTMTLSSKGFSTSPQPSARRTSSVAIRLGKSRTSTSTVVADASLPSPILQQR